MTTITPYQFRLDADEFISCPNCSTDLNYRAEQLFEELEDHNVSDHSCPHCGTLISIYHDDPTGFSYIISADCSSSLS